MWIHLEGARDFYVEIARDIDSGSLAIAIASSRAERDVSRLCSDSFRSANKVRIEAYFRRDVFDSFTAENFLREIDFTESRRECAIVWLKWKLHGRTRIGRRDIERGGKGGGRMWCGYADRSCTAAPDLLFTRAACAFDSAFASASGAAKSKPNRRPE